MPTPIAVVAASLGQRGGREAANAANAEPAATVAAIRQAPRPASDDAPAPPEIDPAPTAANSDRPARPAYADAPSRRGVAIASIACLAIAVVAAGAYGVWRYEGARGAAGDARTASAPTPLSPGPDANAPTPSVAPAADAAPESADASASTAEPPGAPPAATADVTAPVEITALPPHPTSVRSRVAQSPKASPAPATAGPGDTTAMQAEGASTTALRPNVAAAEAPRTADRWQRLDEAIAQCTRADFITRVICGQRARFRYCDGYWGKVPQCPGSPSTVDRGQ